MTEYRNKVSNPDAPWLFVDDTEENIMRDLEHYTLDPVFERCGDFVNRSPEWLDEEHAAKYAGCSVISGNFLGYTHAFYVVTDDEELINRFSGAVLRNKASQKYQEARARMIAKLPVLTLANASIGQHYAFAGGWFTLTKVIHLTEEEANRDSLLYLDHWRGADWQGRTVGAAFTDARKQSSTSGWKV